MSHTVPTEGAMISGTTSVRWVRGTVEVALNAVLDAEADRLCGAGRYERSEARKDTRRQL